MWPRDTVHSLLTSRMKGKAPGSSGATVTSRTRSPEASLSRWNMAASGAWRLSGFWAPHFLRLRKGPSRWTPTVFAPFERKALSAPMNEGFSHTTTSPSLHITFRIIMAP